MASLKDLPVLIVDDNESVRRAIAAVVSKLGFENVSTAGDIVEAWRHLATKGGGIVLCEAVVAGKYGIQLLKKIRSTPQFSRMPVLMMSTKKDVSIVQAHMKAGASEFLVKPFDSAILLSKLKKALAPRPKAPEAQSQEAKLLELGHKALDGYDTQSAIAYFTKAARANAACAEAYLGLAEACKRKKDVAQQQLFLNTAAKVLVQRGDMAEAEKVYMELRLYDAKAPNPFAEAAAALGETGDPAKVKDLYQRAAAVEPDNPAHYLSLGQALLRGGDKDGAKAQVESALKLQDDFAEARKVFKAITGRKWTESEGSLAFAKKKEEEEQEEEKRGTVRFWVPDLLIEVKGRKEHFALTEMSIRSLAFNPMQDQFTVGEELKFNILKLQEVGTRPEVKKLHGEVARLDAESVGVRLMNLSPEQEKEISEILTAAQERQKEQFREEKKEVIKFDIDMLFM